MYTLGDYRRFLLISKSEIHLHSYFEMSALYYCWLLIQTDEEDKIYTLTAVYNMLQNKNHGVNIVIIHQVYHKQSIG